MAPNDRTNHIQHHGFCDGIHLFQYWMVVRVFIPSNLRVTHRSHSHQNKAKKAIDNTKGELFYGEGKKLIDAVRTSHTFLGGVPVIRHDCSATISPQPERRAPSLIQEAEHNITVLQARLR